MKKYVIKVKCKAGEKISEREIDIIKKWISCQREREILLIDGNTIELKIKEFDGEIEIEEYNL